MPATKRKPRVDHHLYHHKFCVQKVEGRPKRDQTVICADCPDPHRPWKRGSPHPYNPTAVVYPLSTPLAEPKKKPIRLLVNLHKVGERTKPLKTKLTQAELLQRRNSQILKESLSGILRDLRKSTK